MFFFKLGAYQAVVRQEQSQHRHRGQGWAQRDHFRSVGDRLTHTRT